MNSRYLFANFRLIHNMKCLCKLYKTEKKNYGRFYEKYKLIHLFSVYFHYYCGKCVTTPSGLIKNSKKKKKKPKKEALHLSKLLHAYLKSIFKKAAIFKCIFYYSISKTSFDTSYFM